MMSLVTIGIVLLLTYLWSIRGFFSSFLHMVCVIAAGAIAFALWEPTALFILEKAPTRGFLSFLEYGAWAIGLVGPFAISLTLLRFAVDKLIPGNAKAIPAVDFVGAGACGLVSGIITAGILSIAFGTMWFKADAGGYQPVKYVSGNLERTSKLILPVDQIVGKLYAMTSEKSFASPEPLAKWRPEPWHAAEVMRMSDRGGKGKTTAKPKDFGLLGRYRVKAAPGENLFKDKWAAEPQAVRMLNGDPYPPKSRIEGIILDLKSTMREPKQSFLSITAAQVWMVAENPQTHERIVLHPIAAIANPKGADKSIARFEFVGKLSIASAGATTRPMAFEFAVPDGYEPIAVYLKNIRKELNPNQPVTEFDSVAARDRAIETGDLIEGAEPLDLDAIANADNKKRRNSTTGSNRNSDPDSLAREQGIYISNRLPNRMTIQKGTQKGISIGEGNKILDGEAKWTPAELETRIVEKSMRIEKFQVNPDVVMVQVNVSPREKASLLGKAAASAERILPPQLVDTNGQRYEAVGWLYKDREMVYLRYTPSQPIRGLSELESKGIQLSASRDDQKLYLFFLCSYGAELTEYDIGPKTIVKLEKPLPLDKRQD